MVVGVTGGTGFLGEALVLRHLQEGHKVRVLSRRPSGSLMLLGKVEIFQGDLTGPPATLVPFVEGVDVLYHCAGEIGDWARMESVNVLGTRNLCTAAHSKIGHWVQLSSVGVYGPHSRCVVTEETPLNPVRLYEKTKAESDAEVIRAAGEGAFSFSILRPSNTFGPTMRNRSLFQLIAMIDRGFFFFIGRPGALANYIYVANVAEALVLCGRLTAARGHVYNLSDYCTIEEFVSVIADELGKPLPKLRLSEGPVRWIAKLGGKLRGFPLTETRVDALTNRSSYPIDRIRKELGYTHLVSMEDGLRQMVRVLKQCL